MEDKGKKCYLQVRKQKGNMTFQEAKNEGNALGAAYAQTHFLRGLEGELLILGTKDKKN